MKIVDAEKILKFFESEIKDAPASRKHHLNIKGGLLMHLGNAAKFAIAMEPKNETLIALAMIHDIGKARTYIFKEDGSIVYGDPSVDHLINTIAMVYEAGYTLTQEELHALQFHHGGWAPFEGDMDYLAIKLHYCDMMAMTYERKLV